MNGHNISASRRAFVRGACIVAGTALIAPGCDSGSEMRQDAKYLIGLLAQHDSAKLIGQAYREEDPAVRKLSLSHLTAIIVDGIKIDPGRPLGEKETEFFADRVREDFTRENVVRVYGWLLSKTEAQLCALLSMYYET